MNNYYLADFASFRLDRIRATVLNILQHVKKDELHVCGDFQKLLTIFDKPVTMKNIVSRQVSLKSYSRWKQGKGLNLRKRNCNKLLP